MLGDEQSGSTNSRRPSFFTYLLATRCMAVNADAKNPLPGILSPLYLSSSVCGDPAPTSLESLGILAAFQGYVGSTDARVPV